MVARIAPIDAAHLGSVMAVQARAYGATGVPFFVVDQRYGIAGAQPTDAFSRTLEAAWNDRD